MVRSLDLNRYVGSIPHRIPATGISTFKSVVEEKDLSTPPPSCSLRKPPLLAAPACRGSMPPTGRFCKAVRERSQPMQRTATESRTGQAGVGCFHMIPGGSVQGTCRAIAEVQRRRQPASTKATSSCQLLAGRPLAVRSRSSSMELLVMWRSPWEADTSRRLRVPWNRRSSLSPTNSFPAWGRLRSAMWRLGTSDAPCSAMYLKCGQFRQVGSPEVQHFRHRPVFGNGCIRWGFGRVGPTSGVWRGWRPSHCTSRYEGRRGRTPHSSARYSRVSPQSPSKDAAYRLTAGHRDVAGLAIGLCLPEHEDGKSDPHPATAISGAMDRRASAMAPGSSFRTRSDCTGSDSREAEEIAVLPGGLTSSVTCQPRTFGHGRPPSA